MGVRAEIDVTFLRDVPYVCAMHFACMVELYCAIHVLYVYVIQYIRTTCIAGLVTRPLGVALILSTVCVDRS